MGTISRKDFIERLNKLENEIWFDGEKMKGEISEHPAFKRILQEKASTSYVTSSIIFSIGLLIPIYWKCLII